jgi:hypothetical protein
MVHISPVYKRKDFHNPISRHSWSEDVGECTGYEVSGGYLPISKHKKEKHAEAEAKDRNDFLVKYPWTPPRSDREIKKAKKLKLI